MLISPVGISVVVTVSPVPVHAQYANAVTDGADVFICKDKCHRALIKRVTHSQARTLRHF